MNRKELIQFRMKVWTAYHAPGNPHYCKRKRNAVFISPANSLEHEVGKLIVCYVLREKGRDFISEAVSNSTGLRHDVVDLDYNMKWEVEKTSKRAERFKGVKDVIVLPLWKLEGLSEIVRWVEDNIGYG